MSAPKIERVDRIDGKGNIREHRREQGSGRTLCGLSLAMSQPACGNLTCARCERIAATRSR